MNGSGRQSAKNVLKEAIVRRDKKTDAFKVLLEEIPWDSLSEVDESLLWGYFISCQNEK